jgi:hypothetical protein
MADVIDYKIFGDDIEFVGGFTNALFGGEGMFLAHLRGPGIVYLQSLPFSRLQTGSSGQLVQPEENPVVLPASDQIFLAGYWVETMINQPETRGEKRAGREYTRA